MCRRWREIPKPTIAMVQGACIAGGLMLAWVVRPDRRLRRRVLRRSGGAHGHPRRRVLRAPVGARTRARPRSSCSPATGSTPSARYELGMVNRVVPRDELESTVSALAERIAQMPRFGLALTKRAVNQAEDQMGMRAGMDSVFGLHHFAHAHNAEVGDGLARPGMDARSMARLRKGQRVNLDLDPATSSRSATRSAPGSPRTCRPSRCRRWTPPRASRRTASGSASSPRPRLSVVSWPRGVRRPGRLAAGVGALRGGVLRAGAPGRVSQNGIFLLAPTCSPTAPTSSAALSCRRWRAARRSGRRPGRSRRRAATWPRCGRTATAVRRRLAAERAEDLVLARGVRRPGVRAVPHRPGRRAAPRPHVLLFALDADGRHRAADRAARRRARASRRSSSTTCSCPTPT